MKLMVAKLVPRVLACLLLALAPPSGLAQEAAPETAEQQDVDTVPVEPGKSADKLPAGSQEATQLDAVMVTATKREASARSLASSVTALTGEQMESQGLRDVNDIVKQVPGVNIWDLQNGSTPQRITIRGISSDQGSAATTGVFLDETPFTDATVQLHAGQPRYRAQLRLGRLAVADLVLWEEIRCMDRGFARGARYPAAAGRGGQQPQRRHDA